jgi:NAD-dependent deacetylase
MDQNATDLAALLSGKSSILVVTGAGISTESGIPDFRGPNGIWKTQQPVEFDDFVRSHERRIDYWDQKVSAAASINSARPGLVHRACVDLERAGVLGAIVTQNVDGLHSLAGSSRSKTIEVHGTTREAGCLSCGNRSPIDPHVESFVATRTPPVCGDCGGLLKPATISFGQSLDQLTLVRAGQAADAADLVVALGTTLSVYPAADIPMQAARRGIPYVIINKGRTDHDGSRFVTLRIEGDVGTIFAAAVATVTPT